MTYYRLGAIVGALDGLMNKINKVPDFKADVIMGQPDNEQVNKNPDNFRQ